MNHLFDRISIRFRLFTPLLAGIVLAVALATVFLTRISLTTLDLKIEQSLVTEVNTIVQMFKREHDLKMNQVRTNLRVLHELFYRKTFDHGGPVISQPVVNQISFTTHMAGIRQWKLDGKPLPGSTDFVDMAQSLFGGTVTIFQLADSGFVRISTNKLSSNEKKFSPISKSIFPGCGSPAWIVPGPAGNKAARHKQIFTADILITPGNTCHTS